jgi:hypothetical protein
VDFWKVVTSRGLEIVGAKVERGEVNGFSDL